MRMYDIIDKKRHFGELTESELAFFVSGYVSGDIPDYQVSALLMAVCFAGMTDAETACLTKLMARSGDMLDLSPLGNTSVDKHSTGGVGDKTTLIISPIVASLGCTVAKLSGRGLGHTGGTIDKLESIPGFRTNINDADFMEITEKCGICVSSAGANLVPADKKLYALRDVTATVSSIPLIVSSIMSKKLAGGAKSIVLDVKTGNGAFMKTFDDARKLAESMVTIGRLSGRNVSAVITNMDRPLGRTVGNSLEVTEAANLLRGENPSPDLFEVCVTLASEMVSLSKGIPFCESRSSVEEVIKNGKAYEHFLRWISLQGGDISVFNRNTDFGKGKYMSELFSPADGYITALNAESVGIAAMMLGAGRTKKEDIIDPSAGLVLCSRVGDHVKKGDPIAILQSNTVCDHSNAKNLLLNSLVLSDVAPEPQPLVYDRIR